MRLGVSVFCAEQKSAIPRVENRGDDGATKFLSDFVFEIDSNFLEIVEVARDLTFRISDLGQEELEWFVGQLFRCPACPGGISRGEIGMDNFVSRPLALNASAFEINALMRQA